MSNKLTHKIRNPRDDSKWIDIYSINFDITNTSTTPTKIVPSNEWKIPGEQITGEIPLNSISAAITAAAISPEQISNGALPSGVTISVNQINEIDPNATNSTAILHKTGSFIDIKGDNTYITASAVTTTSTPTSTTEIVIKHKLTNNSNTEASYTPSFNNNNNQILLPEIKCDFAGHVKTLSSTSVSLPIISITAVANNPISATVNNNTYTISHTTPSNSSNTFISNYDNNNKCFNLPKINYDSTGHIVSINTSTISFPVPEFIAETESLQFNVPSNS